MYSPCSTPYPRAIAKGKALGSVSDIVPVVDIVLAIALLVIFIENNSILSEPSLIFTFKKPLVPLSTHIVPVATELGAELPMCEVLNLHLKLVP